VFDRREIQHVTEQERAPDNCRLGGGIAVDAPEGWECTKKGKEKIDVERHHGRACEYPAKHTQSSNCQAREVKPAQAAFAVSKRKHCDQTRAECVAQGNPAGGAAGSRAVACE
jgi:hypothetical protein